MTPQILSWCSAGYCMEELLFMCWFHRLSKQHLLLSIQFGIGMFSLSRYFREEILHTWPLLQKVWTSYMMLMHLEIWVAKMQHLTNIAMRSLCAGGLIWFGRRGSGQSLGALTPPAPHRDSAWVPYWEKAPEYRILGGVGVQWLSVTAQVSFFPPISLLVFGLFVLLRR